MSETKIVMSSAESITIPETLQDGEAIMLAYMHVFGAMQVNSMWPTEITATGYFAVDGAANSAGVVVGKGVTQADGSTTITPNSGYVFPDRAATYYAKVKLSN